MKVKELIEHLKTVDQNEEIKIKWYSFGKFVYEDFTQDLNIKEPKKNFVTIDVSWN